MFGAHAVAVDRRHSHLIDLLIKYHNNGDYLADIKRVAEKADKYIENVEISCDKPAAVFDLDETCLSNNWPKLVNPEESYNQHAWENWLNKGCDTPIESTQIIYQKLRARNIAIFFITGRQERFRASTLRNLNDTGYEKFDRLIMEPDHSPYLSALAYKSTVRKGIESEGYKIIFNMGDQQSDINGGYCEQTFKLPNPFYIIC